MNFLFKSISGFQFPYSLEPAPSFTTPLWEATDGNRKSDSLPVTVFSFQRQRSSAHDDLIANALHNFKILKLPGILRVLDVIDTNQSTAYVVTERACPLQTENLSQEALNLGLFQLTETLELLHTQAKVVLGTLSKGTVFVNERGEWRLFGLELCSKIFNLSHMERYMSTYTSLAAGTSLEIKASASAHVDSLLLSKLIQSICVNSPTEWRTFLPSLEQGRLSLSQFFNKAKGTRPFQGALIAMYQDLREFHIKDTQGKIVAMSDLQHSIMDDRSVLKNTTPGFVDGNLIPEISQCIASIIETQKTQPLAASGANIVSFIASLLELTCSADPVSDTKSVFDQHVKGLIFESFKSPDRQVRYLLLVYFANYLPKLTNSEVSDRIFPHFVQGLADSDGVMRIETLKRIPDVAPLITERQLNNDLLRHLAKTQVDSDVEIRTWTILTIAGLSKKLSASNNRSGILATAFTKSLKDPEIKPKLAALYGLESSLELFDASTIANKILTVIAPGLLDKNKQVRTNAKSLFRLYLNKLEGEADLIATNDKEEVKVDFGATLKNENDVLIKQFMNNLKVAAPPTMPQSQLDTSAGETQNSDWGNEKDDWDEIDPWDNNGLSDDITSEIGTAKELTKESSYAGVKNGGSSNRQVKTQKSWNSGLEKDGWDSWDQPAKLNTKMPSKASINRLGTVGAKSTTKLKTKPSKIVNTKSDIFADADEGQDDGWGDDW